MLVIEVGQVKAARDAARLGESRGANNLGCHMVLAASASILGDESVEPHLEAAAALSGVDIEVLRQKIGKYGR
jgi:hypothetical protein